MTDPIVSACNITFAYGGKTVLRDVSLDLHPSEVVGLVGPNGAGKSTLVRAILGFNRPSSGAVTLEGRDLRRVSGRQRALLMAYVPQTSQTGFPITVFESVMLGRTPHMGTTVTARDTAIVERLLARLGLVDFADRLMSELSGGERQRVMLARVLAQQARVLILDEPTSALDIGNQLFTLRTVGEIARQEGVAALIAIHDLSLAARFTDRLALLDRGVIRAQGSWRDTLTPEAVHAAYGVSVTIGMQDGTPVITPHEDRTDEPASAAL